MIEPGLGPGFTARSAEMLACWLRELAFYGQALERPDAQIALHLGLAITHLKTVQDLFTAKIAAAPAG